jgi:hypothetical protein
MYFIFLNLFQGGSSGTSKTPTRRSNGNEKMSGKFLTMILVLIYVIHTVGFFHATYSS